MPLTRQFSIERFSAAHASDDALRERFELEDVLVREYDPDAETLPHDRRLQLVRSARPPYSAGEAVWTARAADGRLAALAWLARARSQRALGKPRTCAVLVGVHPRYRGQGLAKLLLRTIADFADRQGYEVMESVWKTKTTRDFAVHLRGPTSAPKDGHRLHIADVSTDLLHQWIANGRIRSPGACIDVHHDTLPRDVLDSYLRVWTHLQSFEPLRIIDARLDAIVARWHRQEQIRIASGERWLSLVARDYDGEVMGLLEAIHSPRAPKVVLIRACGALPRYNGRGLRKWLQAELLLRIRSAYPQVAFVAYRHTPHAHVAAARLAADPTAPDVADLFGVKALLRRLG